MVSGASSVDGARDRCVTDCSDECSTPADTAQDSRLCVPCKKRMCQGTFSCRGAVASATIYLCAECASSRSVFIVWKRSFLYDKKAPPILQNIVMNILQKQRGSFIFYKSAARCGALENSGLSCFIWNRLCKNHSQDALLPRFSLRQASTAVHRVCSD